jgi:hypothetical protein
VGDLRELRPRIEPDLPPALQPDDVRARLGYARIRIDELLVLNGGDLPGADANERQQLTQEAFFHLVGAIEVFAQLANERRNLRRLSEDVSISKLATTSWLQPSDPLKAQATALYANTRHPAPAADPYSGDGLMWRIWNYRHQVTHRRANPFLMKLRLANERRWPRRGFWWSTNRLPGLQRSAPLPDRSGHFLLDPRGPNDQESNVSERSVHVEMDAMFALVKERLDAAMTAL